MDGTRLKRITDKLGIDDLEKMNQKQFNGLLANFSQLDRETVRAVIERIPDLADKVGNYFSNMNNSFNLVEGKDYLEALDKQQEKLINFMDKEPDAKIKNEIARELLEHSKWLRKEAVTTRSFKMVLTVIGMGAAMIFMKGLQSDMKYMAKNAQKSDGRQDRQRYNEGGYGQRSDLYDSSSTPRAQYQSKFPDFSLD